MISVIINSNDLMVAVGADADDILKMSDENLCYRADYSDLNVSKSSDKGYKIDSINLFVNNKTISVEVIDYDTDDFDAMVDMAVGDNKTHVRIKETTDEFNKDYDAMRFNNLRA